MKNRPAKLVGRMWAMGTLIQYGNMGNTFTKEHKHFKAQPLQRMAYMSIPKDMFENISKNSICSKHTLRHTNTQTKNKS